MADIENALPPELDLALAYTPAQARNAMRTVFALDQRMARIVSATTEPILGQMRLAWWRDMLGTPRAERPSGDAVLDAIGEHWDGSEAALMALVDAWEVLVVSERLESEEMNRIARGRSAPFVALFADQSDIAERVESAAQRFVFADLAMRLSDESERALAIQHGLEPRDAGGRLPKEALALAVLEALALRALKRGGQPMMEGRGASVAALKAGLFGR